MKKEPMMLKEARETKEKIINEAKEAAKAEAIKDYYRSTGRN